MEKYMDVFGKLAFVLFVSWVVLAGLGVTDMPGKRHKGKRMRMPAAPMGQSLINTTAENSGRGTRLSNT